MGFFKKNYEQQSISQREKLQGKYDSARHNLLLVLVFSAINTLLLVLQSGYYFLFSAFIPYFLTFNGMEIHNMSSDEYYYYFGNNNFIDKSNIAILFIIAVVILVLYLLSFIFSKHGKVGWLIFALVFFAIDTIALFALTDTSADLILDILFHAWVLYYLISGIVAHYKLKKLPPEVENLIIPDEERTESKLN